MEDTHSITLVDNMIPSQQPSGGENLQRSSTVNHQGSLTKHFSRASVSGQLAKRKYAKWQPDRLGLPSDTETPLSRDSSRVRGSVSASSTGGSIDGPSTQPENGTDARGVDTNDFAPTRTQSHTNETMQSSALEQQVSRADRQKSHSQLDILYENQRGWFFFGVPLYSQSSLLNFDPSAWMTQDRRASPVNITNAQLPDPSWEWAWRTWYVDMSGDVDEQGWQYSFSFGSTQWHGTHPWFHSFVRRRRWVRLRSKIPEKRQRGRSDFENAHMLTEDYFTIHTPRDRSREQSVAGLSRVDSGFLSRVGTKVDEETHLEEVGDIPTLMRALKMASIDRERIDALKKFVREGGEELHYLNDKIPEIMAMFLFQISRWQFVTYLVNEIQELSQQRDLNDKDSDKITRKKDNLLRAVESARGHVTGPDVFTDSNGEASTDLLDLTPVSRHDTLLSKRAKVTNQPLHVLQGKEIKGIPKAAEVGREGHIYRPVPQDRASFLSSLHALDARASFHMFPRGQSCLRRRLAVVFEPTTAGPEDPLLFLYPRWVTSAARRRQPMTTLSPAKESLKCSHVPRPSVRPTWCSTTSQRSRSSCWHSSSTFQSDDDDGAHSNLSQGVGTLHESMRYRLLRQPSFNPFADIENSSKDLTFQISNSRTPPWVHPSMRKVSRRSKSNFNLNRWQNMLQRPLVTKPLEDQVEGPWKMPFPTRRRLLHERFRHARFSSRRGRLDWDGMAELLESVQDDPRPLGKKGENQVGIEITPETALLLSGNTDESFRENIWFVHVRNGCRIQMLDTEEGNTHRRVILSGSPLAIELVMERIRHIQHLQQLGDPVVCPPVKLPAPFVETRDALVRKGVEIPRIRAIWLPPVLPASHPEDIPEPPLSTVKDFAEFVEDLTLTHAPKRSAEDRYRGRHAHRMTRKIKRLFQLKENQRLLSSAALNIALRYFCANNRLADARELFTLAQSLATVRTYNILLQNAASNRNIGHFRQLLLMMPRAHILPNDMTWVALLGALTTPSAKASLITRMVKRGFMEGTRTIRAALRYTVQDSLIMHLRSGEGIESFVALMAKTDGLNWFSPLIVDHMFEAIERLADFEAAEGLINICLEHNLPLDNITLSHVFGMSGRDVFMTIHFALRFMQKPFFEISPSSQQYLFFLAFRYRHYNLSRVLWRYGCMHGSINAKMRSTVVASLLRNSKWAGERHSIKNMFDFNSGRVIAGIDMPNFEHPILRELPHEFRDRPLDFLSIATEGEEDRDLQIRLVEAIVNFDIWQGHENYKPQIPFATMLEAAARVDYAWMNQPWELPWLMENSIYVPVERKDSVA
ncbi:hypothetical protein N7512_009126 [Penicillium capsulatum]|nr:hypothetical protein N7512_009126 [Penicillium capsulatum]